MMLHPYLWCFLGREVIICGEGGEFIYSFYYWIGKTLIFAVVKKISNYGILIIYECALFNNTFDMNTIDRIQDDSGISKIVKVFGDDLIGGISKRPDDSVIRKIVKLINDCCYAIANEENCDSELKQLADALRVYFKSDYCAIGKVDEDFLENCIVSWTNRYDDNTCFITQERDLKSIKLVRLDNQKHCVCQGLKSSGSIFFFNEYDIIDFENYSIYERVLGDFNNTTIIPIRSKDGVNKGFVQLINSRHKINYDEISPFYDSLLMLILLIHQRDELKDAELFKKDYDFISKVQNKINNVDALLEDIMEYLSMEFSAGIVTYRIPLLVGLENKPLFFLRECYIRDEIAQYYSKDDYFRNRLVIEEVQRGGYDKLRCKKIAHVIIDKAKDIEYYSKITNKDIGFRSDTLIIPVLRDYSEKDECTNPQKNKENFCPKEATCPFRLCKYFGVFKLRILKNQKNLDNDDADEWLTDDTIKRLSNLAKHISILLNAIVDKYENKSLDIFQKRLKGTSFTKIKDFDKQCSDIVKKSIHTKICAIYRYDSSKDKFELSASTLPLEYSSTYLFTDINDLIKQYSDMFSLGNNDGLVDVLFERKRPIYYINATDVKFNSVMIVPMIRKNDSRLGVMLLLGKVDNMNWDNLSKTFWEHDMRHVEFIVDVLTRIEESDSERLTFLSRLSHELLRPVTEMVYRNDYFISTAKINPKFYFENRKVYINEMLKNIDMCMMFKYIIDDVEYIYSLSKGEVLYDFEMVDFKNLILEAIRLSEEEAYYSKSLVIKTFISKMPEKLYIDKSRMMQVVINLLRNAIRYSDEHKEISVRYEFNKEMDFHEISFEDFGLPVMLNDKESIFDLYYRSKNASEKTPDGSGMGLYIVKQIMLAHGGDCVVKKDYYPTIFTIIIPNTKRI